MHVDWISTGGTPSPMIGLVTLTKDILPIQVRHRNHHLSGNHASIVLRDWRLTCTKLIGYACEMNFNRGNTFTNERLTVASFTIFKNCKSTQIWWNTSIVIVLIQYCNLTSTKLNGYAWEMNCNGGNIFINERLSDPDKRNFASPIPTPESSS